MNLSEFSGLELMQMVLEGSIPHPPISDIVPMQGTEVKEGFVRFKVKADQRHLNPQGVVSGGFAATVLDSVTGSAVHTMLGKSSGYGTIDLNVKMLNAVPMDQELVAEGKIIHITKRIGVAEGILKDEGGKIYAHATASCLIFRGTAKIF